MVFCQGQTNLSNKGETSPKSTYATFFVKKCQKRPEKAVFWKYLPKG